MNNSPVDVGLSQVEISVLNIVLYEYLGLVKDGIILTYGDLFMSNALNLHIKLGSLLDAQTGREKEDERHTARDD